MLKRLMVLGVLVYLGLAIAMRRKEQRGELTCSCYEDCWCKRPGLSLFRWVLPVGHHFADEGSIEAEF